VPVEGYSMRTLILLVFVTGTGCLSPTVPLGSNVPDAQSSSPDAGCSSDCRARNCSPPAGLCPAQDSIACDPSSGDWVCVVSQDAGQVLDAGSVCTVGQNQTCNDNPGMQSYAGTCLTGGVCSCNPGFAIDPSTGRCQLQIGDAGCSPDCRITNCAPPPGLCPTQDAIACDPITGNWVCLAPDAGSGTCGACGSGNCVNGTDAFAVQISGRNPGVIFDGGFATIGASLFSFSSYLCGGTAEDGFYVKLVMATPQYVATQGYGPFTQSVAPGTYAIGHGGTQAATLEVLNELADSNVVVWVGVSGIVTVTSVDSSAVSGCFEAMLQDPSGNDGGSISGTFATSAECQF
jgi:hypothetical protein